MITGGSFTVLSGLAKCMLASVCIYISLRSTVPLCRIYVLHGICDIDRGHTMRAYARAFARSAKGYSLESQNV